MSDTPTDPEVPDILGEMAVFVDQVTHLVETCVGIEKMMLDAGFTPDLAAAARERYMIVLLELHVNGLKKIIE